MSILNSYFDSETLNLMSAALAAASRDRSVSLDIGAPQRTAMAAQIIEAVNAGERDLERLKLVALNATADRSLHC